MKKAMNPWVVANAKPLVSLLAKPLAQWQTKFASKQHNDSLL